MLGIAVLLELGFQDKDMPIKARIRVLIILDFRASRLDKANQFFGPIGQPWAPSLHPREVLVALPKELYTQSTFIYSCKSA